MLNKFFYEILMKIFSHTFLNFFYLIKNFCISQKSLIRSLGDFFCIFLWSIQKLIENFQFLKKSINPTKIFDFMSNLKKLIKFQNFKNIKY